MRQQIFVGSVAAFGILLAFGGAACGGSDATTAAPAEEEDGGASSSTSSSGGGSSSGASSTSSSGGSSGNDGGGSITITSKSLKAGGALLLGVTSDDLAVYINIKGANDASLEAVPVAGGTPIVIAAAYPFQTSDAMVRGGAVAWWTGLDATTGIGTFNVWTQAGGAKTALNAASFNGMFAASEDGARVAFSVAATADASDIVLTDSATAVAVTDGIFTAANSVNLAALKPPAAGQPPPCGFSMRFVGKKLFASFCSPASDTDARLWFVPEASTTEVRLDNKGTANQAIQPFFQTDTAGTKVFVIGLAPNATGRLITLDATAANVTSVLLEDNTARSGFVAKDGSAVVYRTTAGVRRAAGTGAPAPKTIVADAKAILGIAGDQSRLLVRKLDPATGLVDIRSADTTTENQTPTDIVATATATPFGFTGSNGRVVYLGDVTSTGNKLKSQPAAGGAVKDLAQNINGVAVAPAGDGVIVIENQVAGDIDLYDLRYVDAVTGGASGKISDGVPSSGFIITLKKKLVYTKLAQTGGGLFVADLP